MRKEQFTEGSFVHVIKRGARGLPIIRNKTEQWRFLKLLYYFNAEHVPEHWERDLEDEWAKKEFFKRPENWPDSKPLVKILAFCLLNNHFHLLLKEIRKGGIRIFIHKIGVSMATYFNAKHKEKGSLFQGPYKAKVIDTDTYLRYASVYIQVKNAFEIYPGGIERATQEFDKAYEWAVNYPFCSLRSYAGRENWLIVDKDLLGEIFITANSYKNFAKDCILGRAIGAKEAFDDFSRCG